MISDDKLLEQARAVRERAHAPYSNFKVGAVVVDDNGDIHSGCNVENAAYPEGNCAEPIAIGAMVAAGGKKIRRLLVVGGKDELVACTPCGGCRQRISEFADQDTRIVIINDAGNLAEHTLADLLPGFFSRQDLD